MDQNPTTPPRIELPLLERTATEADDTLHRMEEERQRAAADAAADAARKAAARRRDRRLAWIVGAPGLYLQIMFSPVPRWTAHPRLWCWLGTILLMVGLGFYARSKGRHPAWGLAGVLSIVGWLGLVFMEDRSPRPQ